MLTRQHIIDANQAGLRHRGTETWWSYYTPVLQVAYDRGLAGVDLAGQPDVRGYRYGQIPATGLSTNWAADTSERGLSLAALDGGAEVGSAMWFSDRPVHHVEGMLLPYRGSDGEPLVLPYGIEVWD